MARLLQDLALDIPDAPHLLALFMGRAVVDEVLPPSFLASVLPALRNDSLGVTVVQTTGGHCCADLSGGHMQANHNLCREWHSAVYLEVPCALLIWWVGKLLHLKMRQRRVCSMVTHPGLALLGLQLLPTLFDAITLLNLICWHPPAPASYCV